MKKEIEVLEGEFEFCLYLLNNEVENIDLSKIDVFGWIIVYYVFLFNIRLLKYMVVNKKFCYFIMEKINSFKICLYIVCEFVKYEIVKFIIINFEIFF